MIDAFGRDIHYLRLSVTDLCNLRCIYCMPEIGVHKLDHSDILTLEEIDDIVRVGAELGIRKIRLTGGEPLVRRGIDEIIENIAKVPEIEEICLTTNGILLTDKAEKLKQSGVTRVNISLDTLDPDIYSDITRGGKLYEPLAGIRAAIDAGLTPIKINAVLMGGINEDSVLPLIRLGKDADIHIRFIEIMPVGECADWNSKRFIDANDILDKVSGLKYSHSDGVSRIYKRNGYKGSVGIISPISNHFCPGCDKIRITADGKLKPCLHSQEEVALKGLKYDELKDAIRCGILSKPYKHSLEGGRRSNSARNMNAIGG